MDDARTMTWVVMGSECWGKGKTLDAAKKEFRKAGGSFRRSHYGTPRAMQYSHEPHTEVVVDSQGGLVTRSKVPGMVVSAPALREQNVELNARGLPAKNG